MLEKKGHMQIERVTSNALVVNQLPDGSRVLVDSQSETVFALNATAGAAWDACSGPTTLTKVAEQMQRSLDPTVTEEVAEEAILQLEEKNLLKTSGSSRRQFMRKVGMAALPLVVSLTVADQKAFAQSARSGAPEAFHPNPVWPLPGKPQDPFSPPGPHQRPVNPFFPRLK